MTFAPSDIPLRANAGTSFATRLFASRKFQKWAARFPFTRRLVRREGEHMFDLVAGFCHSQVLMALVKLNVLSDLLDQPQTARALAHRTEVPLARMEVLLRAGQALELVKRGSGERYRLTRRGAALMGVPGLADMIAHHDVLYRDLADPVAFFRGETETELAQFWPYVFGGEMAPGAAATYSDLMAESQVLVAEDTLRAVSFGKTRKLMDVGGGTGAFLEAAGAQHDGLALRLFDLPEVVPAAEVRFAAAGMTDRSETCAGSFKTDPLPEGADTISLVRVLYDHSDSTVRELLAKCLNALPAGGRLVISEPMSGGDKPSRSGDAYFALYTMAMQTGKARSAAEIARLCADAGFSNIAAPRAARPFVTQVVTACRD